MTLLYSKTYPVALKTLSQEKVAKIKNVGTKILRQICFLQLFPGADFSEPWGTFLSMKVPFMKIPLYFMFGTHY